MEKKQIMEVQLKNEIVNPSFKTKNNKIWKKINKYKYVYLYKIFFFSYNYSQKKDDKILIIIDINEGGDDMIIYKIANN